MLKFTTYTPKTENENNKNVSTRQVVRRREFEHAFQFVTGQFSSELRSRRRRIARNRIRLQREIKMQQKESLEWNPRPQRDSGG
jgi:hypothetical protein